MRDAPFGRSSQLLGWAPLGESSAVSWRPVARLLMAKSMMHTRSRCCKSDQPARRDSQCSPCSDKPTPLPHGRMFGSVRASSELDLAWITASFGPSESDIVSDAGSHFSDSGGMSSWSDSQSTGFRGPEVMPDESRELRPSPSQLSSGERRPLLGSSGGEELRLPPPGPSSSLTPPT